MIIQPDSARRLSKDVGIFLLSPDSPEKLLIDLIEEYGSIELCMGISSQPSSRKLIEILKSVTNGFLVLNAVYLENQMIRLPNVSEQKIWEKDWKLPLNWLSPESETSKKSFFQEKFSRLYPMDSLRSLLKAHGIKAFLMTDWQGCDHGKNAGSSRGPDWQSSGRKFLSPTGGFLRQGRSREAHRIVPGEPRKADL